MAPTVWGGNGGYGWLSTPENQAIHPGALMQISGPNFRHPSWKMWSRPSVLPLPHLSNGDIRMNLPQQGVARLN